MDKARALTTAGGVGLSFFLMLYACLGCDEPRLQAYLGLLSLGWLNICYRSYKLYTQL